MKILPGQIFLSKPFARHFFLFFVTKTTACDGTIFAYRYWAMVKEIFIVLLFASFVTVWFGGIVFFYDSKTESSSESHSDRRLNNITYLLKKYEMTTETKSPVPKNNNIEDLYTPQND